MILAYFWILGAVRGESKETIVGIKVVYGKNKHIRSVSSEKWGRCGYFVAVIPFLTATFLDIAVSRDFCVFLDFGGRSRQIQRDDSRDTSCVWHKLTFQKR